MSNIEAIKDAAMRYANCRVDVVRGTEEPNEAKALLDEFYSELRNLEAYVSELEAAQEELAIVEEINHQLREQNTAVDIACAKYEEELAAIRALEPVANIVISADNFDIGLTDDYAFGKKRLPDGRHHLYALPEQK